MNFEGFLRSLQGDFMTVIGALFFVGICFWIARRATKSIVADEAEAVKTLKVVSSGARIIVTFIVIFFLGRAVMMGFQNRMPRNDVDKTGVYEQMDSRRLGAENQ